MVYDSAKKKTDRCLGNRFTSGHCDSKGTLFLLHDFRTSILSTICTNLKCSCDVIFKFLYQCLNSNSVAADRKKF
jgi:hypothetical protein